MPVIRLCRALLLLALLLAAAWLASATGPPAGVETARAQEPDQQGLPWPQRRFAPCAAFDDARGAWYVFGGRGEGGGVHFADTWRIDVRDHAPRWRRVTDAGAAGAPPPLRSCAAAFDHDSRRMLVFGGWDGVTATNGVWALTPGASPRWERLCDGTSCGAPPTARRAAQAIYDPVGRRLLVFGGLDTQYRNDMWELALDGSPAWRRLATTGSQPAPRGGHSLVVDRGRRRAWLFGGTTSGPDLGDTWMFDLTTSAWTQVATDGSPAPRSGAVLVHDSASDRLVLHGGWESTPNRYPRDTWTLEDLDGTPTWAPAQIGSEAPQRRYFGVGTYDRRTRRLLAFGGGVGATALKDVAALDLHGEQLTWSALAPRTPLTARDQVTVGLSARGGRLLAFGGFGSGTFPGQLDAGTHLADSWRLRLGGDQARWRNVTPPGSAPNPLHREAAAVATDTRRQRLVMVGGLEGDDELADVWVADLRSGPARWRQLCSPTSCGAGPQARWGAHAVFDPIADRIVLFGGRRTDGTTYGDVWALSMNDAPVWSRLEVVGDAPAPRWGGAAGYAHRRMVVTGGQTGPDSNADSHADAWALSLDDTPEWRRLTPDGAAPEPRRSAAAAMRTTAGSVQLLVAGGLNAETGAHFNDVWALTLGGDRAGWSRLAESACASTTAPACRRSASAAYDADRDRLVLLFGRDRDRFYADTWTFTIRDQRWRALAPAG